MHRIPSAKSPAYRRPAESGAATVPVVLVLPDPAAVDLHGAMAGGRPLSPRQCQILYWAARGTLLDTVAERLGMAAGDVLEAIAPLSEAGLVAVRSPPRAAPRRDTLPRLWAEAVSKHPERPFLLPSASTPLDYGTAARRVEQIARRLAAAGLGKGSRILLHAEAGVEAALLFWAAMRLGIVVVPVDTAWNEAALLRAMQAVRPALVFADVPRAAAARTGGRPLVVLEADGTGLPEPPASRFADWLASGGGSISEPPVGEGDPAAILFTSGSTGEPRGVELTHGSLVRTARVLAGTYRIGRADRLLSLADLHTVSGLRNPLVLGVLAGAACVLPRGAERRDPAAAAGLCRRAGVTVLTTVPACLRAFAGAAARLPHGALGGLRLILSTGAALPPATAERLRGLTDAPVHTYYGLTETCGVCVAVPPGALAEGSIGVPLGMVAQVVDDDGAVLPPGEAGELRLYGANLARVVVGDPPDLRDGWLYTGDVAVRHADGHLTLVGRRREAVKTPRGDLLTFAEIERVLERDPAVAEAAVCALRDGEGDERTLAFVRLMEGVAEDGVAGRLMQRMLVAFGPGGAPMGVRIVADFPRGANGKVRRHALLDADPGR